MIELLRAPISVALVFDHRTRTVRIPRIVYDGRERPIVKLGHHFTRRKGRTLEHVYTVVSESLCFKIVLDTDTLHWFVEEIHDHDGNYIPV